MFKILLLNFTQTEKKFDYFKFFLFLWKYLKYVVQLYISFFNSINLVAIGACPWPSDNIIKLAVMPWLSANCESTPVGSTPGERTNINGVRATESSNTAFRSSTGGSTKLWLRLRTI